MAARECIEMTFIVCVDSVIQSNCMPPAPADQAAHARGECSSRAILIPSCIAASISPISPCRLASTLASKLAKSCLITAMASWSEQKEPSVRKPAAHRAQPAFAPLVRVVHLPFAVFSARSLLKLATSLCLITEPTHRASNDIATNGYCGRLCQNA